jgi:hypothetical protein
MGFNVDQIIPCTPREVWVIATEWGVAEYWLGVSKLRLMDPKRKPRVGSKLLFDVRGKSHLTTITAWDPPNTLGLQSVQGGVKADYVYSFSECSEGTRAQLEAACSATGFWWKLLLPAIGMMMERTDRKQLEALCQLVELTNHRR